jgi:aminoglycoside phosphotransferase (APT) family kinase protein
VDGSGREVLSYLPGRDQGWPFLPEILTDDGAYELGRLATTLRRALATFPCPPDARWHSTTGAPAPGEAMQHGDLGPWNLLWSPPPSAEIAGVIDWDLAEPGDPFYDTGFLAWFTVPFMDDTRAAARGFPSPPDRESRLRSFARAAALAPAHVLQLGLSAQQEFATRAATRQTEPWPTLRSSALDKAAVADFAWTRANLQPSIRS